MSLTYRFSGVRLNTARLSVSVAAILFILTFAGCGENLGTEIKFKSSRLFYTSNVSKEQAQRLLDLLVAQQLFDDQPRTIQVDKVNNKYTLKAPIREGKENDKGALALLESLGTLASEQVFNSEPVDVQICDNRWKLIRTIEFQPRTLVNRNFKASWDTGTFSHDFLILNDTSGDLSEVDLTIIFVQRDGKRLPVKQFWAQWGQGETQKVNVPADRYQKVELKGTAIRAGLTARIDSYFVFNLK